MTLSDKAHDAVMNAAEAAAEKLATDLVALDVSDQTPLTDAFLIVSARNERMALSIADAVEKKLYDQGYSKVRQEGRADGRWVLLDFGEIIVHVFHEEERLFYQLERLWRDCPVITLAPELANSNPE
tara:strand:+ start:481 stop:861 length:381 start_codon:yes stop_codon:yes gene_type:complete